MPAILTTLTVFARWQWLPEALARHLEIVLAAFVETEFPDKLKVQ